MGPFGGRHDLVEGGVEIPVADVVPDGIVEEDDVLGYHRDGLSEGAEGVGRYVSVSDADGAGVGGVEAVEHAEECGFSGAGGADDGDGFSLGDVEGGLAEDGSDGGGGGRGGIFGGR